MNLISLDKTSKTYTEKILLQDISIGIDDGDKIGLLGINGSGKSTLLKLIAGLEEPDQGQIVRKRNLRMQYLAQNPVYDPADTVMDMVFKGDTPIMKTVNHYRVVAAAMEQHPLNDQLQKEMAELSQQMDAMNGWALESEAQNILSRLGITQYDSKMNLLSGGQRKRAALAAALLNDAELLILDEPTNHLDNQAIDWLETYLQRFSGALLMVTHDRYFLERVSHKIIEIDRGRLLSYTGNYSAYLEKKLEREQTELTIADKNQALLRKELAWIRKGARARSTKQKARIERFEKLQSEPTRSEHQEVQITSNASRLGKKTIIMENVSHAYQDQKIIDNYSCRLDRGERMGIIGANGVGKTTLLEIMHGAIIPRQGRVDIGETVKIGYFPQESTGLPDDMRLIDYIREAGEYLPSGKKMISAAQMLETFLFPSFTHWTRLEKLSGGEKRRLHLLRILMTAPNVLLLDEPGNDLDIETLKILEDYLDDFPGAVVTVSHDRYFLDRVCEKILAFEKSGKLVEYPGNYSDFLRSLEARQGKQEKQDDEGSASSVSKEPTVREKLKTLKFTFREQKEFAEIDDKIATVENELQEINDKINHAGSDYRLLDDLNAQRDEIIKRQDDLLDRWTYLNELAEAIEEQKKLK
ncbi:MAG TPA: ABC-F family ATP-binding cassette domain-containing protein [Syntrophomonas sp.]|nr:ABC-F family ATP-binding cassette domain-containing protein [Syntrophomonas sp.]